MTTCPHCTGSTKKFGWTKDGRQRFRCLSCRKVTAEEREKPLGDMRLPLDRALLCLNLLCEGSSVRAIERITVTEKKTILRLLVQVAWHLGRRNGWDAHDFVAKLSTATAGTFQQLTTDGFNGYPNAVEYNLGARTDYVQVVKEFANVGGEEGRRYAPPRLRGQEKIVVSGNPDEDRASTSHVERANWTLAPVQRLQPKEGQPPGGAGPLLRLLQLLPDA